MTKSVNELSNIELKKASILDFTDNLQELRIALQDEAFEVKETERWGDADKMFSLLAWAEYKNDKVSLNRLKELFEKELTAIFNE
jgi:hypothetical protein